MKEQSQLDEAQEEAELQQEKASLRLFEAKLEKDQSTWVKYKAALDEYSSTQRIGKVEFLRAQDQELTAKAAELQDDALPVKFLSHCSICGASLGCMAGKCDDSCPGSLHRVHREPHEPGLCCPPGRPGMCV